MKRPREKKKGKADLGEKPGWAESAGGPDPQVDQPRPIEEAAPPPTEVEPPAPPPDSEPEIEATSAKKSKKTKRSKNERAKRTSRRTSKTEKKKTEAVNKQNRKPDKSRKDGHRKRLLAAVIDGTNVIRVSGSNGVLSKVTVEEFDTLADAARAAAKIGKKKNGTTVWAASGITARKVPKAKVPTSEKAKAAGVAELLEELYSADTLCALHGLVGVGLTPAVTPDRESFSDDDTHLEATEKAADHQAAFKAVASVNPIAGAVLAGEEDGMWVRVGFASTDLVAVVDGEIKAHKQIGDGNEPYTRRIAEEGRDAVVESIGADIGLALRKAANAWRAEFPTPSRAWLHGPGASPMLTEVVASASGFRVFLPTASQWGWEFENPGDDLSAVTALCASKADPLAKPERTFKQIANKQQLKTIAKVMTAVAILAGVVWWSWRVGDQRQKQMAAAEARRAAAETEEAIRSSVTAENTRIALEQRQILTLLGLDEQGEPLPSWPDWRFGLLHPYLHEGGSVDLGEGGVNFTLPAPEADETLGEGIPFIGGEGIPGGVSGHIAAREAMDRFAVALYGPCTIATGDEDTYAPLTDIGAEADEAGYPTILTVSISVFDPENAEATGLGDCAS